MTSLGADGHLIWFVFKQVVGNSLKSLEVSEEKANQRVEEFKRQLKSLTVKLKEAENRAELAEKTVKKLQKEVDRLEGTFLGIHPKKNFIASPSFLLDKHKTLEEFFTTTTRKSLRNLFLSVSKDLYWLHSRDALGGASSLLKLLI